MKSDVGVIAWVCLFQFSYVISLLLVSHSAFPSPSTTQPKVMSVFPFNAITLTGYLLKYDVKQTVSIQKRNTEKKANFCKFERILTGYMHDVTNLKLNII